METQPASIFKLESKGLRNLLMTYLFWTTSVFAIIGILILFGGSAGTVEINGVKQPENVAKWINLAAILFLLAICTIIQQIIVRGNHKGLTIKINDEMIELTVPWRVPKLFYFTEITHVSRTAPGTIHLYAKGKRIIIPHQISKYDDLATFLRLKFPSLNVRTFTFYHKHFLKLAFIAAILFMSLLIFKNKIVLSLCGLSLIGLFLGDLRKRYSVYKAIKSKGLRTILIYELTMMAIAIFVLITKLIK